MTQEQKDALKVTEKLISDMGSHTLSAEEIMILTQGILSNDCGGCTWKYVQAPHYQPGLEPGRQSGFRPGEVWVGLEPGRQSGFRPGEVWVGLEPGRQSGFRPGEVWVGDHPKIDLYSTTCTTTLDELPCNFKNEKDIIEEVRKTLEKNGDPMMGEKQPGICASDNIPNMQYVVR